MFTPKDSKTKNHKIFSLFFELERYDGDDEFKP